MEEKDQESVERQTSDHISRRSSSTSTVINHHHTKISNSVIQHLETSHVSGEHETVPLPISRIRQPISHYKVTETLRKIYSSIQNKSVVILHCFGVPGSGKSQTVQKLGEKFPFLPNNDSLKSFIKWHIQCCGTGCLVKKEFLILAKELRRHSFITSHEAYKSLDDDLKHVGASNMVQVLFGCNVPVLLIIEDPDDQSKSFLRDFCRKLEQYRTTPRNVPFHVYITSQKISKLFSPEEIKKITIYQPALVDGFTKTEAVEFLNDGSDCTAVSDASIKVYERFSGMPLGLQAARSYCRRSWIDYQDYLEIIISNEIRVRENESSNSFKDYGESEANIFQAIVMPFKSSDDLNTEASLRWKVLSCLSYFNPNCIPKFLLERCYYILLDDPQQKKHQLVKAYAGQLISDLLEYGMCIKSIKSNDISIHEVILNAFRFYHQTDVNAKLNHMKKAVEILCSLVSKDLRKNDTATKLFVLRPHMQSLLTHIDSIQHIFSKDEDSTLMNVLLSHLYEITAAISYSTSPTLLDECEKYYQKALSLLWQNACEFVNNDSDIPTKDRPKLIVEQSISKGLLLPSNFVLDYASKLYFCFEETEFELLKSLSQTNFNDIEQVFCKHESKKNLIRAFQKHGYFLSTDLFKKTFYADRFASILYSWSRKILFANQGEESESKCIGMSTLSKNVAIECRLSQGVHLLTEWLPTIEVLVPIWIRQKGNPESLEKALNTCHNALSAAAPTDHSCMYEYGMVKETNDYTRPYPRVQLLRNLIRAYSRVKRTSLEVDFSVADDLCQELFQLTLKITDVYANSSLCLVYCAKYYASRENFEKSMDCFQAFFALTSLSGNKRRFKRYCWTVYNYARATLCQSDPPADKREEAIKEVEEVLRTNDVMTDDMNTLLKHVLTELKQQLT